LRAACAGGAPLSAVAVDAGADREALRAGLPEILAQRVAELLAERAHPFGVGLLLLEILLLLETLELAVEVVAAATLRVEAFDQVHDALVELAVGADERLLPVAVLVEPFVIEDVDAFAAAVLPLDVLIEHEDEAGVDALEPFGDAEDVTVDADHLQPVGELQLAEARARRFDADRVVAGDDDAGERSHSEAADEVDDAQQR
jgi:hypothetical protein